MAKLTAWLVTIIGILLLLRSFEWLDLSSYAWLIPLLVLIIGIGKLMRNYSYKKRR